MIWQLGYNNKPFKGPLQRTTRCEPVSEKHTHFLVLYHTIFLNFHLLWSTASLGSCRIWSSQPISKFSCT